jgi:hypothetical protein
MIPSVINIVTAETAGEYKLHLTFDDGKQQTVDFRPFLARSIHPSIHAYLDPQRFSEYRIEYGELVWGDYDLCFPVADLYLNNINKHDAIEQAA